MGILMLDTETTGLNGGPYDLVVDIAISEVDFEKMTVTPLYSAIVQYPDDEVDRRKDAWIFLNTDLTTDMVKHGTPQEIVRQEVAEILEGRYVTSYNVAFDFDKFIFRDPWFRREDIRLVSDPMLAVSEFFRIPYYDGTYRFVKLERAYQTLCPTDPAHICGKQDHRALSDTIVAGHLMLQMFCDGQYNPVVI